MIDRLKNLFEKPSFANTSSFFKKTLSTLALVSIIQTSIVAAGGNDSHSKKRPPHHTNETAISLVEQNSNILEVQQQMEALIGDQDICVVIEPLSNESVGEQISINNEKLMPFGSSFKVFLGLYYLLMVPEESQNMVQVENAIINSDNDATSWLIQNANPNSNEPLALFNDFLMSLGFKRGLYKWQYFSDSRFDPNNLPKPTLDSEPIIDWNVTTAQDLVTAWKHLDLLSQQTTDQKTQTAAQKILQIALRSSTHGRGFLEKIDPSSFAHKYGYYGIGTHPIIQEFIADAGIITLQDNRYAIAISGMIPYDKPALELQNLLAQLAGLTATIQ